MEGRWKGPLPFEGADDCRVQLFSDHRFDFSCSWKVWVGAGKWAQAGDQLVLHCAILSHSGQLFKTPAQLIFQFTGHGNSLDLASAADGTRMIWVRTLGGR